MTQTALETPPDTFVTGARDVLRVEDPLRTDDAGADCERFVRTIYERHGRALLRFAARLLGGDWDHAEDILQEATLRAWRHIGLLGRQQEEGLRPWLFTVVRNLVIDDHRARAIRPATACTLDQVVIPIDDEVERTLTRHTVTDALHDLTVQQQQIIHRTYFLRQSVAEVSQALGIPQGTVKSRTYYAIRALRTALHERGVKAPGEVSTT
ncbi:sigma-70 family RNA polymerase sigma factor [Streptomyces fumanus]|uniref:RNA polymerase sigma factor n=1 Tax=Streptomyces fumanus TaxID=67302 RepID=A0A919B123_9ACTN|nr:sigma-70 family RNA polymerase sigma factor [Streptomyces fumanus]GHF34330.1 RNA polymerase sigma factor [Streptomyces fumanus]